WVAWLLRAQDVDPAEQRRRATVAHGIALARLSLAVVGEPIVLPESLPGDRGARAPEVLRLALIRHVGQHPRLLPTLDLPEGISAELEVVALLIDRVGTAAIDQDSVLDLPDQIVERHVVRPGLEPHVWHALERNAVEALRVAAAA